MGKDLNGKELGPGITQRKDGRYEGKYIDRMGKRKSIYNLKLSVLKKELTDIKYEITHGIYSSNPTLTLDKWFEIWIKEYKEGTVKESTQSAYEYTYKHISKEIGFMKLQDIKPLHLQKIINNLSENEYAFSTIKLTRITMHAIFDQAVENGFILKNPASKTKLPQDTTKEKRVLSVSEQELFLKYSPISVYSKVFELALQTGMRSGELGGLKWEDIDFENKKIQIRRTLHFSHKHQKFILTTPKSKASIRIIPLTEEAIKILKERRAEQLRQKLISDCWNKEKCFNDLVFSTKNGRPCGHATFNNAIKSILTKINNDIRFDAKINGIDPVLIESFSMHSLRHTFATRAFEKGMKPKVVQEIMGHTTLSVTTDLYMHTTQEHLFEEMEKYSVVKVS